MKKVAKGKTSRNSPPGKKSLVSRRTMLIGVGATAAGAGYPLLGGDISPWSEPPGMRLAEKAAGWPGSIPGRGLSAALAAGR